MSQPCSLYRYWDAAGRLLYVGISINAVVRLSQHADKPWFADVASMTREIHPTREAASAAEKQAIRAETPLHNRMRFGGSAPADKGISRHHYDGVKALLDSKGPETFFCIDIAARMMDVPIATLDAMVDVPVGDIPRIAHDEMYVLLDRLYAGDETSDPIVLRKHTEKLGSDRFRPTMFVDQSLARRAPVLAPAAQVPA